jgi:proteasome accessory factor A
MLLGAETEYAVTGLTPSGAMSPPDLLIARMMDVARRRHPFLHGSGDSMFLPNGARFYVDRGPHPEYATPECRDPWQVLRFIRAGERFVEGLATEVAASYPRDLAEVLVFRTNVDLGGDLASWGCHESYMSRSPADRLASVLIPHLVSRVIYSGAGGFNPFSRGLEFTRSPRAAFITSPASGNSTSDRGIYHTKNEPLANGPYHRVHVLCGETLCSDRAALLKLGATALVVAAVDAGARAESPVDLKDPVDALGRLASDPTGAARVSLLDGRQLTAVELQRHYLALVESAIDRLPPWAGPLCAIWSGQLDRLERDPPAEARTLDWAIKRAIYGRFARGRGVAWDDLPAWNRTWAKVYDRIRAAIPPERRVGRVTIDLALDPSGPAHDALPPLTELLAERGQTWEGLRRFLSLRDELLEAELRFGLLGPGGLFHQLDGQGLLDHRLVSPEEVAEAVRTPPLDSRARARGEAVAALGASAKRLHVRCDWMGVWDDRAKRHLDLADPFVEAPEWRSFEPRVEEVTAQRAIADFF